VLLDTGALLALADETDAHHTAATDCLIAVARHRLPVFIAVPTIYETHRRILFSLHRNAAVEFLDRIYDGSVNVVQTIHEDEQRARGLIQRYADQDLTLVDAANMAVMIRLGIAAVFSFDAHFLQSGLIRIPPFHL
jgi:predicted nucleic acid-binding protein